MLEQWRKAVFEETNGLKPEDFSWETPEGIKIKQLYTNIDSEHLDFKQSLPGFPPYVRGVKASMYTVRPWTIRQYAGFSTAEESNKFYLEYF